MYVISWSITSHTLMVAVLTSVINKITGEMGCQGHNVGVRRKKITKKMTIRPRLSSKNYYVANAKIKKLKKPTKKKRTQNAYTWR